VQTRYFYRLWLCLQSSIDSEHVRRLSGFYGETCYVLLRHHFSNTLYGAALRFKVPPIKWLTKWLATKGAGSTVASKYARVDLGEELVAAKISLSCLLRQGTQSSRRLPTRPIRMSPSSLTIEILERIRAMVSSASLGPCFWPYAFIISPTPQGDHSR
jgi:hypothetical protein